jgi:hypothetical protein
MNADETRERFHKFGVVEVLPPANPNALGLHITDEEWQSLRELLQVEPAIIRVRVYGSRQTGVRRPKPITEPLDIDLAIEVSYGGDPSRRSQEFWSAKNRLEERAGLLCVQIEDLADAASPHFKLRQAGVLILDRGTGGAAAAGWQEERLPRT